MTVNEVLWRYNTNGLANLKLRNDKDLQKIHKVTFEKIKGFSTLSELNKKVFLQFLVNFFNQYTPTERVTILPKKVYYTADQNGVYLIFEYIGNRQRNQIHIETSDVWYDTKNKRNEYLQ